MSLRLIEVTSHAGHLNTLRAIADQASVAVCKVQLDADERCAMTLLVGPERRQRVLDDMQACLGGSEDWRIVMLPVEAAIPAPEEPESESRPKSALTASETREELFQDVSAGTRTDFNYLLLVFLSTIVAAVGLITDNLAVVIGAMVIAPLLGPNLAFIFATALGDKGLMWRAVQTNLVGLVLALVLSFAIAFVVPVDPASKELLARTDVGPDGVVIALASGATAALSLSRGLASTLVGVMVAVALLPPTATIGLMLAIGQFHLALGAALLLAVNVVCLNLAGQIVLLAKGLRPRTWLEKRAARQSVAMNLIVWILSLALLGAVLYVR